MNLNNISNAINILKFGILLLIVAVSFIITRSSMILTHPELATAITIDLILTLPLAYLFFIKKTKISKLTVVPLFVFGTIFASFILPANNQNFLHWIKLFALPVLELGILGYVGFIFYKSRKTYQSLNQKSTDVMEILRETLAKEFPVALAANALTFEIAVFYYAVIGWKAKRGENTFTYHKKNGAVALLSIFVFLIFIETTVLHVLLADWNNTIAWILTIFSVYFLFQIIAHGKAFFQRPIEITDEKIFVRCGLRGDAVIDVKNIEKIEIIGEIGEKETDSVKLSALGKMTPPNVKISVQNKAILNGFYGMKKEFKTIFLTVDETEKFKQAVENILDK
ncbi:MAG: hypothetical protein H0X15_10995 [Acidobacteria bacterium]|nr:hypothetical protein [Acidobacteriota bacterium]MBA3786039.1 hypothetical protein [Acidobacteriota bacterium]MBA4183409.1 hypothetical protein [Acidobacteriota bacterium]